MPNDLDAYRQRLANAPDTPLTDVPLRELMVRLQVEFACFHAALGEQAAALVDVQNTLPAAIALLDAGDLKGARAALARLLDMVVQ